MAAGSLNLSIELLPEDLMSDVLCRLSIKEIIYCKSVCKSWYNLISSSCFAYLHLSISRLDFIIHDVTHRYPTPGILKWFNNDILLCENDVDSCLVTSLNLQNAAFRYRVFPVSNITIAGSVDGLICVWSRSDGTTYVFNPTLSKEYLSLPNHQDIFSMFPMLLSKYAIYGCGFGVSSSPRRREYKVVIVFQNISTKQSIEIVVFTLGTNLWRRLTTSLDDVVPYGHKTSGIFFNFHLHWIVNGSRIFAFELDTEAFKLFSSPPIPTYEDENSILGVINGCLSCGCWFPTGFTIWGMKEYGINNSWYKVATVNHKVSYSFCLTNGFLMFLFRDTLMAYSLETNTVKPINLMPERFVRLITYHPSFLNLHNFVSDNVVLLAL